MPQVHDARPVLETVPAIGFELGRQRTRHTEAWPPRADGEMDAGRPRRFDGRPHALVDGATDADERAVDIDAHEPRERRWHVVRTRRIAMIPSARAGGDRTAQRAR